MHGRKVKIYTNSTKDMQLYAKLIVNKISFFVVVTQIPRNWLQVVSDGDYNLLFFFF